MTVHPLRALATTLLNAPFVRQTRRNHGLEHATITLLSRRVPNLRMAGRSTHAGFVLIGDVETPRVVEAVSAALDRMRAGEHGLAIHPNCGTNLVTTGFLGSLVAVVGLNGAGRRGDGGWARLPMLMVGMMMAVLVGQPLGTWLQKYVTTDGDPADLEVLSIDRDTTRIVPGGDPLVIHRVRTRSR